jgi:hypothetical protein
MELINFYFRKSNFEVSMIVRPDHLREGKPKDWKGTQLRFLRSVWGVIMLEHCQNTEVRK